MDFVQHQTSEKVIKSILSAKLAYQILIFILFLRKITKKSSVSSLNYQFPYLTVIMAMFKWNKYRHSITMLPSRPTHKETELLSHRI